uniref:Uncharacterized protein n=1 Tax=Oryza brachyantha TaxID=4533 RepID=J3LVT7_ORYBR
NKSWNILVCSCMDSFNLLWFVCMCAITLTQCSACPNLIGILAQLVSGLEHICAIFLKYTF